MWHRRPWAGPLIRLLGLALIALAVAVGRALFARSGASPAELGVRDWLLALVDFASASVGGGMLLAGAHLFDQIEVSARWRRP